MNLGFLNPKRYFKLFRFPYNLEMRDRQLASLFQQQETGDFNFEILGRILRGHSHDRAIVKPIDDALKQMGDHYPVEILRIVQKHLYWTTPPALQSVLLDHCLLLAPRVAQSDQINDRRYALDCLKSAQHRLHNDFPDISPKISKCFITLGDYFLENGDYYHALDAMVSAFPLLDKEDQIHFLPDIEDACQTFFATNNRKDQIFSFYHIFHRLSPSSPIAPILMESYVSSQAGFQHVKDFAVSIHANNLSMIRNHASSLDLKDQALSCLVSCMNAVSPDAAHDALATFSDQNHSDIPALDVVGKLWSKNLDQFQIDTAYEKSVHDSIRYSSLSDVALEKTRHLQNLLIKKGKALFCADIIKDCIKYDFIPECSSGVQDISEHISLMLKAYHAIEWNNSLPNLDSRHDILNAAFYGLALCPPSERKTDILNETVALFKSLGDDSPVNYKSWFSKRLLDAVRSAATVKNDVPLYKRKECDALVRYGLDSVSGYFKDEEKVRFLGDLSLLSADRSETEGRLSSAYIAAHQKLDPQQKRSTQIHSSHEKVLSPALSVYFYQMSRDYSEGQKTVQDSLSQDCSLPVFNFDH